MRIALDTNVLVSGLLSPFGAPGEIVRLAAAGDLEIVYDPRILTEYREVLLRPRFGFERPRVEAWLDQIETCGHPAAPKPLEGRLPDPDDEPFLEAALGAGARCLVTGNLRHYPADERQGMAVVSPKDFLGLFRKNR